jgi:hypothetical protein
VSYNRERRRERRKRDLLHKELRERIAKPSPYNTRRKKILEEIAEKEFKNGTE